jgi:hypothetical protein
LGDLAEQKRGTRGGWEREREREGEGRDGEGMKRRGKGHKGMG